MHFAGLQKLPEHPEHVQVTSRGLLATCNVVSWGDAAAALRWSSSAATEPGNSGTRGTLCS